MAVELHVPEVAITVDGSPLRTPDLVRLRVERSAHAAERVSLVLGLPGEDPWKLLDDTALKFGAELQIRMGWSGGRSEEVADTEIVAVEISADDEGDRPEFHVTGLDRSHRLARRVRSRTYLKMTVGDIARQIANSHGLTPRVANTSIRYEYLLQDGSDHAFLTRLAQREDLRWWVEGRTLHLGPWAASAASVTATWGRELRTFRVRGSVVDVRDTASVRGWDAERQQAISGKATTAQSGDGVIPGTGEGDLASRVLKGVKALGAAEDHLSTQPVVSMAAADLMARDRRARVVDEGVVAEGELVGTPALEPGGRIVLAGVGTMLSRAYRVTEVVHDYDVLGFRTRFVADGRAGRSLVDLLGGGEVEGDREQPGSGITFGIVTNVNDPSKLNRVKVKLPWLHLDDGKEIETDWIRLAGANVGGSRGFEALPQVNDEVAVGFEHGDVLRPIVLGAVWSKRNAPSGGMPLVGSSGVVERQRWRTKAGHIVELVDQQGKEAITITHKDAKTQIALDTQGIAILSPAGRILIDANSKIEVKAKGPISLEAPQITAKANGRMAFEAATISIKATASLDLHGATAKLSSDGATNVESSGLTQVKGSILKLN